MRIDVHWNECEANGVCVGVAPEVFELDDDDQLHLLVTEVPPVSQDAVRAAVSGCPKRALYLADGA